MNFPEYFQLFDQILTATESIAPYDDVEYLNYTKLNKSRLSRWMKKGELLPETIETLKSISTSQKWILITEPWCGDASHSVGFIVKMAEQNPLINFSIELRDASPNRIEDYLTNGGKAIPKLIIRNDENEDILVWGPRPAACQEFFLDLKEQGLTFEEQKIKLQEWYNLDKGKSIQAEILAGLNL